MSNSVYTESFFSNKEVPMCEKLGLISLLGGGTYEEGALSYNGQDKSFMSFVFDRRQKKTPVIFTYGHPETLSAMACKTLIHNMGLERRNEDGSLAVSIDNLFDGSMSDRETVEHIELWYKGNPNIDKTKFTENFDTLRLPKVKKYLEQLKNSNSYLANNPKILEGVLETTKEVCGSDKKKQMMA